jgi:hypothetical protein
VEYDNDGVEYLWVGIFGQVGDAVSVTTNSYEVSYETAGQGAGDSTSARVIGEVTCDVEGIQDDALGSITGAPSQLLQRPADITEFILTRLYPGITIFDLGQSWVTTRLRHRLNALTWAFRLEWTEFQKLRRKLGEQARSVLYLDAGKWEYTYLDPAPAADITLDYARDVWDGAPARLRRTLRADVKNSLTVFAQRDYAKTGRPEDIYRHVKLHEDLAQGLVRPYGQDDDDKLQGTLELDLTQDAATAVLLGEYWLSVWKRQRFTVELVAWQNVLALAKADYLAFTGHPILDAHGGAAIIFRITAKRYLLGDEHPARIRLTAIEATP